jgi:tetratricopeptide (TPR) repeat protein
MLNSARFARHAAFALLLVGVCIALAGCGGGGHGKYTSEHISQAQERMSMIKSGTEWQMAHQQFLAGDLDKALKTIDRSIGMNEKVPKSHVLRGRILLEKSRLEEARQEFLTAQKLDPNFVEAHYYLGIVYERVNQTDDALACYRKAMEIDSANAQYVVAGAEMLIAQNRLDDADKLLEERKQYLQYNPAIRQTQGQIAQLRNDPKRAAQLFSEALLLAPGDQSITEDLVQAQLASAQYADAESHIGKLLDNEANKGRTDLKSMRAKCFIALNRPVDARTLLEEITSDKDGASDLRSWIDLGNVCAILHDKGGLRTAMQRVTAMAPDRPDGYMLKAMFCRQDNRLADAIAATDQAIAKTTAGGGTVKDASPFVLKAIIQQDQGLVVEARATLVQSQKVDPDSAQVRGLLNALDRNAVASHPDAAP